MATIRPKTASSVLGAGLLVFGLGLAGLSLIWLVLQAREYEATIRLAVEKYETDIVTSGADPSSAFDPYWVQTEFEKIQSKMILFQVISNLGLGRSWALRMGKSEPLSLNDAYTRLKTRMEVRQARNTDLITITVRSEDPVEAASVANEITRVYKETRLQERRRSAEKGIAKLEEEVLKLERQIGESQGEIPKQTAASDAAPTPEAPRELQKLRLVRDQLRVRIQQERLGLATVSSPVRVLEPARLPERAGFQNQMGALVGLWFGVGLSALGGLLRLLSPRKPSEEFSST